MKIFWKYALAVALGLAALQARAINIVTCEPEWAALVQELAGDKAAVFSATTALQDPHRIEARPSLIARMRNADLLVCTGAELETGWLPLLLSQSGNPRVQAGRPGNLEAAQFVERLEIPARVDRSQGDVHAGGNPHIHTDARNIAKVAAVLGERLAQIDAPNALAYRARTRDFLDRWRAAVQKWEQQAAPIKGMAVVVHHREWTYLLTWLGLREAGSLEPRPGVPPTPTHLAGLLQDLQRSPAQAVIYSPYNDARAAAFLSQRARIPAIMLPYTVGGSDRAKDLFGLFDDTLARLLSAKMP